MFLLFLVLAACCYGNTDFTWNSTTNLSDPTSVYAPTGKIVSNKNNSAIAVWTNNWIVESAYSPDNGLHWYPPQADIASPVQSSVIPIPQVVLTDADAAIAVFPAYDEGSYTLEEAYSSDGGNNWATQTLETSSYEILTPQIAIQGDGLAVSVWAETDDGTNYNLQGKYSQNSGQTWTYSNYIVEGGINPRVAINIEQLAIVIWESDGAIMVKRSLNGGEDWAVPDHPFTASGATPQIAMNAEGNAAAVWNDGGIIKYSESWDGGNTWSDVLVLSGSGASAPKIAVNGDSYAIVVWQRNGSIEYISSLNSTPTVIGSEGEAPEVSFNSDGIASVAFSNPALHNVQVSTTIDEGATFNSPVNVSSADGDGSNASISVNDQDYALVLWSFRQGAPYVVQTLNGNFFHAYSEKHLKKLFLQTDYVTKLYWDAMPNATLYRVYLDSDLNDMAYEGAQTVFYEHGQKRSRTYYIVWVDFWGEESSPISISVAD